MFRVDDVVRPGGCSNKTGGSYPMMIYPNIVNMLGEMTVDVNALCLDRSVTYKLMIEQRQVATCTVVNPAIARCTIPKIYDWGTKTVFFQPESTGANDEKAFVGYIYFVPPTLDPMRLDIGNIYDWFKNPIEYPVMPISWFPRNFTNPDLNYQDNTQMRISDDTLYAVQLGLYVIGYKETKDDNIKKFRPEHRVLCRLTTYANRNTYEYRFNAQKERINLNQVEHWYMNDWERMHELYTFRVGYLKLAPIRANDQNVAPQLLSGLVSSPISLHWLWTSNNPQYDTNSYSQQQADARTDYVVKKATEMCHDWYDEDGAQWNFLRDTETNASCPCMEIQAKYDLGRFMPHPRCSQVFRDITCTTMIGAKNCYMSASNIYGSYAGTGRYGESESTSRFPTHYGQVCCYDEKGYLMQTTYQPVIKVIEQTPYNPGFPLRAYEFGTAPYMGQFEVPGLSAFHHDYMPYFLCCK
uniref:AMOP domain-containing protein n=1 Tax=Panagrolaimus sp. ES5 TaxID=591445 RepID=A0AC34GA15_9BILA